MLFDWNLLKPKCPKCNSINIERTIYHKQAYDTIKGTRREFTKWICKDCKNNFWR